MFILFRRNNAKKERTPSHKRLVVQKKSSHIIPCVQLILLCTAGTGGRYATNKLFLSVRVDHAFTERLNARGSHKDQEGKLKVDKAFLDKGEKLNCF